MKNTKTQTLTRLALLSALIFLMSNLVIKLGPVETTIGMVPVAIGAITMGPKHGAILGAVLGTASFMQCFGLFIPSVLGEILMSISPVLTILLCYVPRILMGYLVGVIFKLFRKKNLFAYGFSAFMAAFLNTLFFMAMLLLFFWNAEGFAEAKAWVPTAGNNPLVFAVLLVWINAIFEMAASCILGGAGAKAVDVVTKRLK